MVKNQIAEDIYDILVFGLRLEEKCPITLEEYMAKFTEPCFQTEEAKIDIKIGYKVFSEQYGLLNCLSDKEDEQYTRIEDLLQNGEEP